jgi:hypothetical protein
MSWRFEVPKENLAAVLFLLLCCCPQLDALRL